MNFLDRWMAKAVEPHFVTSSGTRLSLRDFGLETVRCGAQDAASFVNSWVCTGNAGNNLDITKCIRSHRFAAEIYLTTYSSAAHVWGESRRLTAASMKLVTQGVEAGLTCIHTPVGEKLNTDFLNFLRAEVFNFIIAFEDGHKNKRRIAAHRMQDVLRSAYSDDPERRDEWKREMEITEDGYVLLLALEELRNRALLRNANELAVDFRL